MQGRKTGVKIGYFDNPACVSFANIAAAGTRPALPAAASAR